jgi:hypothetical protein
MAVTGDIARDGTPARVARSSRHRRPLITLGVVTLLCAAAFGGWLWVSHSEKSERPLSAGEQVALASGVTLTVPSGSGWQGATQHGVHWPAAWLYRDRSAWSQEVDAFPAPGTGRPVTIFGSYPGEPWQSLARMTFAFEAGIPPLAYTSPDWRVKAYWRPGDYRAMKVLVVTRLPGKQTGVIMLIGLHGTDGPVPTARDVDQTLARVWRELSIEGVAAPVVSQG